MAGKFVISLKLEAGTKGPQDLLIAVQSLPGHIEILEGKGRRAMTVVLPGKTALQAAQKIDFVQVEPYTELDLL